MGAGSSAVDQPLRPGGARRRLRRGGYATEDAARGHWSALASIPIARVAWTHDGSGLAQALTVAAKTLGVEDWLGTYAEAKPGSYVHDGAVSVTYWVQEWPRERAWCTALVPALADGSHRRSFGMIYEPLGSRTAEHAGYPTVTGDAQTPDVRPRKPDLLLAPRPPRRLTERGITESAPEPNFARR
jgi:hypothetical protein